MRLNSAEYPIEKRIVVAKEDGVCYSTEKNSLAEVWDRLMEYYSAKVRCEQKCQADEDELLRMLSNSRIEAETGAAVYELIEKDVLSVHKVKSRSENACEFKQVILESCMNIIRKGIECLKNAIKREEVIWQKAENTGLPLKLIDGEVRMYVNELDYIVLDNEGSYVYPQEWKPKGLRCTVVYMEMRLECWMPPKGDDDVEMVKEYFMEQSMEQNMHKNGIEIEVCADKYEECARSDEICKYVIEELREGRKMQTVFGDVVVYLSRMLVDVIVSRNSCCSVLRYSGENLEDGLPEVFFVVSGNEVIRVERNMEGFEIFVNEMPVRFFMCSSNEPIFADINV
ncbi:hypothetical protein CWI41_040510 [Ordospora colligata]|nr:hypothetical protein CWI41_040510 [Ordospora colligata]